MKIRLAVARLIQLHYETHPKRVAATVGLSAEYCKRLWAKSDRSEWPDNRMALAVYAEMKRTPERYCEHETVEPSEKGNPLEGLVLASD
jgi:hypothetical protein